MRPVVVDSTEFFDEILSRARGLREPTIASAALMQDIRIFAGSHVALEVPQSIKKQFTRRKVDVAEGSRLWNEEYLPYVFFVDTEGLPVTSADMDRLSARDASDLEQARLTTLLAPVISLSTDSDLIDHGFATRSRWATAWASEARVRADGSLMVAGLPLNVGWVTLESFYGVAGKRWGSVGRLGALAAIGLGFWILGKKWQAIDPGKRTTIVKNVKRFVDMVMEADAARRAAFTRLDRIQVAPEGLQNVLTAEIASVLAVAPEPPTTTELSQELWGYQTPVDRGFFQEVRRELEQLPAFVAVSPHRWQLGASHPSLEKGVV
jgi:hypothetical protein